MLWCSEGLGLIDEITRHKIDGYLKFKNGKFDITHDLHSVKPNHRLLKKKFKYERSQVI